MKNINTTNVISSAAEMYEAKLVRAWEDFYMEKGHKEMIAIAAGNGVDRCLPISDLATALARKTVEKIRSEGVLHALQVIALTDDYNSRT